MTAASRRLLGALLAVAFVAAAAPGQDPAPPAEPAAADPKNPMTQILAPVQTAPDAVGDMVSFLFVICCLAAGVMAVAVAARVYARVRHDDPIIAAVNDPWVQAKIAQGLPAEPDAGEVEVSPADGRSPGHR